MSRASARVYSGLIASVLCVRARRGGRGGESQSLYIGDAAGQRCAELGRVGGLPLRRQEPTTQRPRTRTPVDTHTSLCRVTPSANSNSSPQTGHTCGPAARVSAGRSEPCATPSAHRGRRRAPARVPPLCAAAGGRTRSAPSHAGWRSTAQHSTVQHLGVPAQKPANEAQRPHGRRTDLGTRARADEGASVDERLRASATRLTCSSSKCASRSASAVSLHAAELGGSSPPAPRSKMQ
jgi:hypothetical protein